jgi:uracil-DNA glycosylase
MTTPVQCYDAIWAEVEGCRACRDDTLIPVEIRVEWETSSFVAPRCVGPEPQGLPVTYLLVAEEPSTQWAGKTRAEAERRRQDFRNFNWTLGDFVIRWAAHEWLVEKGREAFLLTDLGRCSVPGRQAGLTRARRYRNCHTFLDREVGCFRDTLRAIVPVGEEAAMWCLGQAEDGWPPITDYVLHWANRFSHRTRFATTVDKAYQPDCDAVNEFIRHGNPESKRLLTPDSPYIGMLRIYKQQFEAIRAATHAST